MFKYKILIALIFTIGLLQAYDIHDKIRDATILINAATKYLAERTLSKACHAFMHDISWRKGDLLLSLVRDDGTVIADALNPENIWEDMTREPAFKAWLHHAEYVTRNNEKGWTLYAHNNDVRALYATKVKKDDMNCYLCVGFYPEDSTFETELFVNSAADFIEHAGSQLAFKDINDSGVFASGDIVIAVLGFDSTVKAYAQRDKGIKAPSLFSKAVIEAAEKNDSGWIESISNNATHKRYYQKVFDKKTETNYIVTAGFYKDITRENVYKIVAAAINTIKRATPQDMLKDLGENANALIYGHAAVRIFDAKGTLLFDARVPNELDHKGEPSELTQDILATIQQKKTGWKALIKKSTAYLLYYETLAGYDNKQYIITAGFYPKDKSVTVQAIVDHGAYFFERHTPEQAFEQFSDINSLFRLGDISLVVYTLDGVCLLNNDRTELIWSNLKTITDQEGRFIVPSLQLIAKRFGSGWANFTLSNSTRRVYARRVYSTVLESAEFKPPVNYASYIVAAGYFV